MSLLVEVSQDSNHWCGVIGPLVIVFWTSDVKPGVCQKLEVFGRRHAARQEGRKIAVLSIVAPTHKSPPSAEARDALAQLAHDTRDYVVRIAVLHEGRGFIPSVVSSVVLGIRMVLTRSKQNYLFFSELGEALRWLTEDLEEYRSGALRYESARMAVEYQSKRLLARWMAESREAAG